MEYPSNIQFRCTGGGSVRFNTIFKEYFKDVYISQDAIWENVRGLHLMSKVVWK